MWEHSLFIGMFHQRWIYKAGSGDVNMWFVQLEGEFFLLSCRAVFSMAACHFFPQLMDIIPLVVGVQMPHLVPVLEFSVVVVAHMGISSWVAVRDEGTERWQWLVQPLLAPSNNQWLAPGYSPLGGSCGPQARANVGLGPFRQQQWQQPTQVLPRVSGPVAEPPAAVGHAHSPLLCGSAYT